jgi:hypothetical protein
MPQAKVSTGKAAFIEILDPKLIQRIYKRLDKLKDKRTSIKFRKSVKKIAIVFSDGGEIRIGVEGSLSSLKAVEKEGGRYLVYAPQPVSLKAMGGGPDDPPPPNTMCPC